MLLYGIASKCFSTVNHDMPSESMHKYGCLHRHFTISGYEDGDMAVIKARLKM